MLKLNQRIKEKSFIVNRNLLNKAAKRANIYIT